MLEHQEWPFSKPLEFLQKVKYGGAVGKKTVIICVALLVLAICSVSLWHQIYAILAIVVAIIVVVVFGLRSIDGTLEKHPELALMDGAEIIRYRQIEMAAKNRSSIPDTPLITDPQPPPRMLEMPAADEVEETGD